MQPTERRKLAALMGFHSLWGLVLWFSISNLGLGLSTDSVHLLFAGQNLSEGRGLTSFDGVPVLMWPPLYPLLLGGLHLLTGLSAFAAAHILQVIAFIGLSICLSLLFLRIFPNHFALALAANILADIGAVVVSSFDLVGSDYVHLFFAILVVLLAAHYIETGSPRTFVALALAGMLALLQRYLGIAAIATAALSVLLLAKASLPRRLVRSAVLSLAALPAAVWLLSTWRVAEHRAPVPFVENFQSFSRSALQWFLPDALVESNLWLYTCLLWVFALGLIVIAYRSRRAAGRSFTASLLLFGLLYLLALFSSAAVSYFNKLEGRFLLPLYIPAIALLLVAVRAALEAAAHSNSPGVRRLGMVDSFAFLALMVWLVLRVSVPIIQQSHAGMAGLGENAYNTKGWQSNSALRFWQVHEPAGDYLLLSNEPDGVAFYTGHTCNPSPRRSSGPYGTVEFPVTSYRDELFAPGGDVYLVWIPLSERSYYYAPDDLRAIAVVDTWYEGQDGAIYRLRPKPGD